MSKARGKRTTLTVDRETFEAYFYVGSDGIAIARDAMDRGMIRTPYEAIELVCHANRLEAEWYYWDMVVELEPHGKDDDYIAAESIGDTERTNHLILEYVGRERLRQMLLDVRSDVREELGIPEVSRRVRLERALSLYEEDDEEQDEPPKKFGTPMKGEPAFVRVAPWRFERHFELDGAAYWVVLDAFRQSVIATPYEMVEMLCNANLMYSKRLRENAWRAAAEHYGSPEELRVAVENGTYDRYTEELLESEWFKQMFDSLLLEMRTAFGVAETSEIGAAERYELWLDARRKTVN